MATNAAKLPPEDLRFRALRDYATKAQALQGVAAVVYLATDPTEVFTFIETSDDELCHMLYEVEDQLFDAYQEQLFGFHIRALEGRGLQEVLDSTAKVLFSRADA